jgi:hypothetical protein
MLAALVVIAADPPKPDPEKAKKDKAEEVRKEFYQCWLEIEETESGVTTSDPKKLVGRGFGLEAVTGWPRRTTGELSLSHDRPGPRIDPTADPMHVDFRIDGVVDSFPGGRAVRADEKLVRVLPCIFKFDKGNLVIAYGDTMSVERELKKGEDYPGRPTDFTSTKENKRKVTTLKPSSEWASD